MEIGILIALLIGVSEVAKRVGLPQKYLPVVNLILGVVAGIFTIDAPMAEQVITGAMVGLSASGLYDQTKIITKKK